MRTVARLRDEGVAILLVEQNARAALRIADHGYVLDGGRVVLEGDSHTLQADARVAETYLGSLEAETAGPGRGDGLTSGPRGTAGGHPRRERRHPQGRIAASQDTTAPSRSGTATEGLAATALAGYLRTGFASPSRDRALRPVRGPIARTPKTKPKGL